MPLGAHAVQAVVPVPRPDQGQEAREQRANGLLIVDDADAVLDLTLLPEYERAPYLANVFGIVRVKNMRKTIEWFLNNGKDSPLTTTRDGFDTKHELTKLLFAELEKQLGPVYRREEERFNKGFEAVPTAVRQRISDALKELNRLLREVAGDGEQGGGDGVPDPALPLQFFPRKTRLFVGKPRRVDFYSRRHSPASRARSSTTRATRRSPTSPYRKTLLPAARSMNTWSTT
jgi:hypothetical protein